jgi:hypothetical protein
MTEDLGSTNITDLINEDDTDMNDDMVNKILNELENEDAQPVQNNFENDNNFDMDNNSFEQEITNTFSQKRNPTLDFRDPDFNHQNNINLESENTVKKINSIIDDSNGLELSSISSIINNFKIPLIVFILCIVFNNPVIIDILSNLLHYIIKNTTITSYISLILRTIIITIIIFLLKTFNLL